ncbi:hypothetical protein KBA27_03035 [bacterium]|nr:hypothetical protein [bacterium]
MITGITAKIFSQLGSNSSLLPMGIKDGSNSLGMTAGSYLASNNKVEGKDRFIDEFGTQAIWLFGLPFFKKIIDLTAYKVAGFNSKVDTRVLENKDIADLAQKYAKKANKNDVADSIKHALDNKKVFKGMFLGKFIAATALTMVSYGALTSYRHKYTEKEQIAEIKKEMAQEKELAQNNETAKNNETEKSSVAFGGVVKNSKKTDSSSLKVNSPKGLSFNGGVASFANSFMFNPVRNMMILDAGITGERLADARNPQDFMGYAIKEGGFWAFMYFAGEKIQEHFEKKSKKKYDKSIDLDIRVLQDKDFQNTIKDGKKVQSELNDFLYKTVDGKKVEKTDAELYEYICNNPENVVVKTAKQSEMISEFKEYSQNPFEKALQKVGLKGAKSTGNINTQEFIDLSNDGGMRTLHKKISTVAKEFEKASGNETIDEFFKKTVKLKRLSILKNIGACVGFLGVIIPGIMVIGRKSGEGNEEFQVKKELKEKIKNGELNLK